MPSAVITRFLAPGRFRRAREAEQVRALRSRDGDSCARCRRPLRFDLPAGHDQGAIVEAGDHLCHRRCSPVGEDHTDAVAERMRRKAEAALFAKSRRKRRVA